MLVSMPEPDVRLPVQEGYWDGQRTTRSLQETSTHTYITDTSSACAEKPLLLVGTWSSLDGQGWGFLFSLEQGFK